MRHSAVRIIRRGLTTAAAHPPHATPSSSHVTASTSAIPLSNVEAQWATLNPTEQTAVHQQLEELQRKDWKSLSLAEKKAGTSCPVLIPIIMDGLVRCSSLLCRVWPSWSSCVGEPPRYDRQDPHRRFCPHRLCRSALCRFPLDRYAFIFASNNVLTYSVFILLFSLEKKTLYSPTATQNDQQGVGRSHQRACKRAQDQPHLRSVNFSFTFVFPVRDGVL